MVKWPGSPFSKELKQRKAQFKAQYKKRQKQAARDKSLDSSKVQVHPEQESVQSGPVNAD